MDDFELLPHDESKFDYDASGDIWGLLSDMLQRTPRNKTTFEDLWSPDASQQKRQKVASSSSNTVKDDNIRLLESIHDPAVRKLLSTLASDEPLPDPQRIIQQINANFLRSPAKPPMSPHSNRPPSRITAEDAGIALLNLSRTSEPALPYTSTTAPSTPPPYHHVPDPSSPLTSVAMAFFAEEQEELSDPSDQAEDVSQSEYCDVPPMSLPPISEAPMPVYHQSTQHFFEEPVVAPLPSVSILCSHVGNVMPFQFPLDLPGPSSNKDPPSDKESSKPSPPTPREETAVMRRIPCPSHSSENVVNIGDACVALLEYCDKLKLQHNGEDIILECEFLCHLLQIKRRRLVDLMQILQVLRVVSNQRGKPIKYVYHGRRYLKSALALIQRDGFINFPEVAEKFGELPDLMAEKILELRVFANPTGVKRVSQPRDDSYPLPHAVEDYLQLFLLGNQRMSVQDTLKLLHSAPNHCHRLHLKQLRESTKIQSYSRRLYDITNVLCALNLLKKQLSHGLSLRQNLYVWDGYNPEEILSHYRQLWSNMELVEIVRKDSCTNP